MDVDAAAWAALLQRQDGLATRAQAVAAGFTTGAVDHRLGLGDWQVVARGVLLTTSGEPTRRQRLRAGLLRAGEGSVLTAASALELHGLEAWPYDPRVHVVIAHASRLTSCGLVEVHRSTRAAPARHVRGLPAVWVPRAVVDACLRTTDLGLVRAVVAESVQRRRCTVDELACELEHAPRRGSAAVRTALDEVAAGARSRPEAVLLRALRRRRGLPAWELNVDVVGLDGCWLARPDVVFAEIRLVVEVDGQRWHLSPERWSADVERHTALEAAGWTVLRYPAARVLRDAEGVAAEIALVALRLARP